MVINSDKNVWNSDFGRDYALLDCGGGERLERWGEYVLIRPDPTAIWDTDRSRNELWRTPDARYVRSRSGGGTWDVINPQLPNSWNISYLDLTFRVNLMNFKHTGIFPEQAANWNWIRKRIGGNMRKTTINVLNLFAYTGASTLACAAAGAAVCHVDAAKGMVDRARTNAKLSGLEDKPIRWITDDCREFVRREARRGRGYDAIIMDPPSYGRGTKGEMWKLEDDLYGFCKMCTEILSDDPSFVLINSYTAGLSPATLTYIAESTFSLRFHNAHTESRELAIKSEDSGLFLPAGASCRWTTS
ncbi:MAG: class I SAM-dependent methyltransferase [Oscillospiraceae bacterium]|jgi:23S rRNA (cytosine1962-C5)-methyltransferase|nr:class I SAM-dependent methyltransferase [Oscillospiraceae bacterium]